MPILLKMPKKFSVKTKFTFLPPSLTVFGCVYIHIKVDMFHVGQLVFKGKSGKKFEVLGHTYGLCGGHHII